MCGWVGRVGWGGARAVRREENLGEKKGLTCKKCDLGGQNAKTQHGLKMDFSSRRSFCTGWAHKRSTGRGRAPRVKIGSQLTPRMVPNRALSALPVGLPHHITTNSSVGEINFAIRILF